MLYESMIRTRADDFFRGRGKSTMWCPWLLPYDWLLGDALEASTDSSDVELLWLRLRARSRLPDRNVESLISDARKTVHFKSETAEQLKLLVYVPDSNAVAIVR